MNSSAVGPVRLADALGWGSSVLGAPMNLAPRRFLRAIGVDDDDKAVAWTQAVGVREHLATLNIVANRQRRIGMWSRVAGDTMDMALLVQARRHRCRDADRLHAAMAAVAGFWLVDLITAIALSRADRVHISAGQDSSGVGVEHDTSGGSTRVLTAVTINRPEDDVRGAFATFDWSRDIASGVRYAAAPGDRGTEVHVDVDPGSRAAKATINDELRRFKALVETGEVPRSETSPEGPSALRQIFHKRGAQPVGGGD